VLGDWIEVVKGSDLWKCVLRGNCVRVIQYNVGKDGIGGFVC